MYKYTWLRMAEGRMVDRTYMDYVLLPKRMHGRLLDVKVWRGEGVGMSDQFFCWSSSEIGGWLEECQDDGGCEKSVKVSTHFSHTLRPPGTPPATHKFQQSFNQKISQRFLYLLLSTL